jgi:hypothetical protein
MICINRAMTAASEATSPRLPLAQPLHLRLRRHRERAWLALDLLIVAWLCWLFDAINNLAPVRQQLAVANGHGLLDVERALHLDPERALNQWLARRHALATVVVFWYENVHITVTLVVFAWLWWRRPNLLGTLAVFWSLPTAPPRMLSSAYVDLVARTDHLPVWQLGATALHSNQLCSMPSLHLAWATWSSIAVWQMTAKPWLRALAVVYPLLTTFAVMATGNHYLLDAIGGAALTGVVFLAMSRRSVRTRLAGRSALGAPASAG